MFPENFSKSKIFTAAILIILGVLGRFFLINFIGLPNFEIITALTLISAVFLGRWWALIVPLGIIATTDVFIGNTPVLIFTWSAFAIIGVLGTIYKKYETRVVIARSQQVTKQSRYSFNKYRVAEPCRSEARNGASRILGITGVGIISSVFFYLYTNFGWWLVSNMYPPTLDGLIQCYLMGLPFFKNNLIGNLIFVPGFSAMAIYAIQLKTKFIMGKIALKNF